MPLFPWSRRPEAAAEPQPEAAREIDLDDIHFALLTSHDVVRHRLVGKIVDAYERYDAQTQQLDRGSQGSRPPRRKGS